jgi:hypothetical protein
VSKTTLLAVVAGAVLGIGILAAVTVTVISEDNGGGRRMVLQVEPGPGPWMAPPPRTVQPPDFGPLPAPPDCLRSITIGPRGIRVVPGPVEKRRGACRMLLPPRFPQR